MAHFVSGSGESIFVANADAMHATLDCWHLERTAANDNKKPGGPVDNVKRAAKPFHYRGKLPRDAHATSRQGPNKKSKTTSRKQDSTTVDSSDSSENAVSVNNMEFGAPDHVGSLGLENLEIK